MSIRYSYDLGATYAILYIVPVLIQTTKDYVAEISLSMIISYIA